MLNLIGNSCIASWITNSNLKQKFINPFCWNIMDFNSAYNLVKNYETIDYSNYKLIKDNNWNFSIIVDNLVTIQFVHYKFSPKYDKPTKIGEDIFYNKIWEYIIEKYEERIKRLLEEKAEPIFIFACAKSAENKRSSFTLEEQKKLEKLNSKYKIILSFDNMINSDKFICISQTKNYKGNTIKMADEIYKKLKEFNIF